MSAYAIGAARNAVGLCGQIIRSRENVRAVVGTLALIISEAAPTEIHTLVCADNIMGFSPLHELLSLSGRLRNLCLSAQGVERARFFHGSLYFSTASSLTRPVPGPYQPGTVALTFRPE